MKALAIVALKESINARIRSLNSVVDEKLPRLFERVGTAAERRRDLGIDARRLEKNKDHRENDQEDVCQHVLEAVEQSGDESHRPSRINYVGERLECAVPVEPLSQK